MDNTTQGSSESRRSDWSETQSELYGAVYEELRNMAHFRLNDHRRTPDLTTTALVHEAYLKLSDNDGRLNGFDNRAHFFSIAALAMRQIITDMARKRRAVKRGGRYRDLTLDEEQYALVDQIDELIAIDDALRQLERWNPRLGEVVNLKFFAGLGLDEIANVHQQSRRTVARDWQKARAFLRALMAA